MNNSLRSESLDTLIKDNSDDKYNWVNLEALNNRQQVMYIIDAAYKAGFISFTNVLIAQLYNFTCI